MMIFQKFAKEIYMLENWLGLFGKDPMFKSVGGEKGLLEHEVSWWLGSDCYIFIIKYVIFIR